MNLFEYTHGRVVADIRGLNRFYGHIVGFDEVHFDNGSVVILKVLWQDGVIRNIHPSNVELG